MGHVLNKKYAKIELMNISLLLSWAREIGQQRQKWDSPDSQREHDWDSRSQPAACKSVLSLSLSLSLSPFFQQTVYG